MTAAQSSFLSEGKYIADRTGPNMSMPSVEFPGKMDCTCDVSFNKSDLVRLCKSMTASTGSDYRILLALQYSADSNPISYRRIPNLLKAGHNSRSLSLHMLRAVRRNALRSTIAAKALAANRRHRGGVEAGGDEGQVV